MRQYGSKMRVELEEPALPGMEAMEPYLRSCLTSDEASKNVGMDMEFAVSFLYSRYSNTMKTFLTMSA